MRFAFPPIIRHYRNKGWYLVVWLPYIAAYQFVNRFPLFEPRELEFTALDTWAPFVPELLPVYVAYIPFYWWTVSRSRNDLEANRVFYATHFQLLVSLVIFVFFPVRMPRELFYSGDVHSWAAAFWFWFDAPNNCFPSLHVSNCLYLMYANLRRRFALFHVGLPLLIIFSTVLVKQHYVVDLAGGFGVFLLSLAFMKYARFDGFDAAGWLIDRPAPSRSATLDAFVSTPGDRQAEARGH